MHILGIYYPESKQGQERFGEKTPQLCEVSSSPPGSPVRPGATQHLLPEGWPQALAQYSMPLWLRSPNTPGVEDIPVTFKLLILYVLQVTEDELVPCPAAAV